MTNAQIASRLKCLINESGDKRLTFEAAALARRYVRVAASLPDLRHASGPLPASADDSRNLAM
jgi:hypothetical protein